MENTSDSFMPRPLLFCLKSGRSVCYSVPDNTYESKWKKENLLVYAKNEKEHRQQKIEEEPYQQIDLSSFIDTGKNHVPDFGTNEG